MSWIFHYSSWARDRIVGADGGNPYYSPYVGGWWQGGLGRLGTVLEKGCSVVGGETSVKEIVFVGSKKRLRSLRCGWWKPIRSSDSLTSISNLGSLIASQGKYEETEAIHQPTLRNLEKVLGPENPSIGISKTQFGFEFGSKSSTQGWGIKSRLSTY